MKRIFNLYFFIAVCSLAGIAGTFLINRMDPVRTASRDGAAMGAAVRMTVGAAKSKGELDEILGAAFDLVGDIEKKLTGYGASSDVSMINANAGSTGVKVSGETWEALAAALRAAQMTDGAYDPTIGPVASCWRENLSKGEIPTDGEILAASLKVGHEALRLSAPDSAFLDMEGGALDLGGIDEGYASALVRDLLREHGVTSALIEMGGSAVALGGMRDPGTPERKPWRVEIQDPSAPQGTPICAIELREGAIATAGSYERSSEAGGKRYANIYDPAKGRPVEGRLKSTTIISNDPAMGDALSTAFMVTGVTQAIELMRALPGFEAVFISETDGGYEILATSGLKDMLKTVPGGPSISFYDIW
ncbi:MAG: FAD:protein FMN transferase [Synergistaceae bacterium]|jgi:thiamine biosynthesis lipoprotein|nr:FAD:protein FMN transferase [Synergistaceae bacterium]